MQRVIENHKVYLEWRESFNQKCDVCGSADFTEDSRSGDVICMDCGLVVEERMIDSGKEWRSFDLAEESRKVRTGLPASPMLYDKGLTTLISKPTRGLSPEQRERNERMIKTHQRNICDNVDRNMKVALDQLQIICNKININPELKKEGAFLYRKGVEQKLSRGRPMLALMCACLYAVCKESNKPRCLEDFSDFSDVKSIRNCLGLLINEMGIKVPPAHPMDYVQRFATLASITHKAVVKAYMIVDRLDLIGKLTSKDPRGFASACLYLGCKASSNPKDRRKTQKDIAVFSKITEVTVRKRLSNINKWLTIRMPD